MDNYPVWRGPAGGLEPQDRARVDAAIEASTNLNAVIGDVDAAKMTAEEAAGTAATDAATAARKAAEAAQRAQEAAQKVTEAAAEKAAAQAAKTAAEAAKDAAEAAKGGADTAAANAAASVGSAINTLLQPQARFLNGMTQWSSSPTGLPTAAASTTFMSLVSDDAVFGTAARWAPTNSGNGFYSRGSVPWDRPYRVTYKLRCVSIAGQPDGVGTVTLTPRLQGLSKDYLSTGVGAGGNFTVPNDGSIVTVSVLFSPNSGDGADFSPTGLATANDVRPGMVRGSASGTPDLRIERIEIRDATAELALLQTRFEAAAFNSRAAAIAAYIPSIVQTLSVVHDGDVLRYRRLPAGASNANAPLMTAGSQYWIPIGDVTLRHWGAVADFNAATLTGTDARAEFQRMIYWAIANNVRKVHVNIGQFYIEKFTGGGSTIAMNHTNLEVVGYGMWASSIYYKDKGVRPDIKKGLIFRSSDTPAVFTRFADLSIESDWGVSDLWSESGQCIALGSVGGVFMAERLRLKGIPNMGIVATSLDRGVVQNCVFDTLSRDALHMVNSWNVTVKDNLFLRVCDDSVVVTRNAADNYRENTVVTGNVFVDSQGVYVLGSRNMTVAQNKFVRTCVRGIRLGMMRTSDGNVGTGRPASGNLARYNIDVSNNHFIDGFGRTRWGAGGGTGYFIAVYDAVSNTDAPVYDPLYGLDPIDATPRYVWGPDGKGGVVAPDAYWKAEGNYIGNVNVTVVNNSCIRTLQPTASYLDYGVGPRYISGAAPWTGDVVEADFMIDHFMLSGTFRNVIGSGNMSFGARKPWTIFGFNQGVQPDFVNMLLSQNINMNFSGDCAYDIDGEGFIQIEGGIIDGDPLHRHSGRLPNGRWATGALPVAYKVKTAKVSVKGGSFKNVAGLVLQTGGGGKVSFLSPVTIMADLAGWGDNAANKGIRNVPRGVPIDYAKVGADPSVADYGKVISLTDRYAEAMPNSGNYLEGQVVNLPQPQAAAGYLIDGWLRATTGSAHVLGTDWKEIRRAVA